MPRIKLKESCTLQENGFVDKLNANEKYHGRYSPSQKPGSLLPSCLSHIQRKGTKPMKGLNEIQINENKWDRNMEAQGWLTHDNTSLGTVEKNIKKP